MEASQTLSIESFSYRWLINLRPPFETLEDALRASLESSDETAFIEMDPKMTVSKRFLRDAPDFNFPISQSPLTLVHADEIFSNGLLLPLFLTQSQKVEALNTLNSVPTPSILPKPWRFVLSINVVPRPFLKRCWRSTKKIFWMHLGFLRPLSRKVRDSSLSTRGETMDARTRKLKASPELQPRSSTDDWADIEGSIYEAVLHCKRSIEK